MRIQSDDGQPVAAWCTTLSPWRNSVRLSSVNLMQDGQIRTQHSLEAVLATQLRGARLARGWSQAEVAEKMKSRGYDWHQTTVAKTEASARPLRVNELQALASSLGLSLAALLPETDDPPQALAARGHLEELHLRDARLAADQHGVLEQIDLLQGQAEWYADERKKLEAEIKKAEYAYEAARSDLRQREGEAEVPTDN